MKSVTGYGFESQDPEVSLTEALKEDVEAQEEKEKKQEIGYDAVAEHPNDVGEEAIEIERNEVKGLKDMLAAGEEQVRNAGATPEEMVKVVELNVKYLRQIEAQEKNFLYIVNNPEAEFSGGLDMFEPTTPIGMSPETAVENESAKTEELPPIKVERYEPETARQAQEKPVEQSGVVEAMPAEQPEGDSQLKELADAVAAFEAEKIEKQKEKEIETETETKEPDTEHELLVRHGIEQAPSGYDTVRRFVPKMFRGILDKIEARSMSKRVDRHYKDLSHMQAKLGRIYTERNQLVGSIESIQKKIEQIRGDTSGIFRDEDDRTRIIDQLEDKKSDLKEKLDTVSDDWEQQDSICKETLARTMIFEGRRDQAVDRIIARMNEKIIPSEQSYGEMLSSRNELENEIKKYGRKIAEYDREIRKYMGNPAMRRAVRALKRESLASESALAKSKRQLDKAAAKMIPLEAELSRLKGIREKYEGLKGSNHTKENPEGGTKEKPQPKTEKVKKQPVQQRLQGDLSSIPVTGVIEREN